MQVILDASKLEEIERQFPGRVAALIQKLAQDTETRIKTSMTGPKSGAIYDRMGAIHQASAPGEAPAIDTGNLINSIVARQTKPKTWEILVGADYGAPLEYGAPARNLKPRPFILPAVRETARTIPDELIKKVVE